MESNNYTIHGNGYNITIEPTINEEFNPDLTFQRGWLIIDKLYNNEINLLDNEPNINQLAEIKIIKNNFNCIYPEKIEKLINNF